MSYGYNEPGQGWDFMSGSSSGGTPAQADTAYAPPIAAPSQEPVTQAPSEDWVWNQQPFSSELAGGLLHTAQAKPSLTALDDATANKTPEMPSMWETLAGGVNKMMGDPDQLGKIFGGAVSSAAAGVMAWLKQKQADREAEKRLRMEKQVIDEKVSRASTMPTLSRMTTSTPGKRPVNTYARKAGGY